MLPHGSSDKRRSIMRRLQQGQRVDQANHASGQSENLTADQARSRRITRETGIEHPPYRATNGAGGYMGSTLWGERSISSNNMSNLSQLRAQNRSQNTQRLKDVQSDAFKGKLFAVNDMRLRLSHAQSLVLAFVSAFLFSEFKKNFVYKSFSVHALSTKCVLIFLFRIYFS